MAYATLAHLVERYGNAEVLRAADRDGDGVADEVAVERAIIDASEEINSYLARRYQLPLAQVPGLVTRLACDITMYRLSADPGAYTEEKRERYDDAVRELKAIAAGDTLLPATVNQAPPDTTFDVAVKTDPRQWSRDKTGGVW